MLFSSYGWIKDGVKGLLGNGGGWNGIRLLHKKRRRGSLRSFLSSYGVSNPFLVATAF